MIELNKIYNEDCLEGMKRIPDGRWIALCAICRMARQYVNGIPLFRLNPYGNNIYE